MLQSNILGAKRHPGLPDHDHRSTHGHPARPQQHPPGGRHPHEGDTPPHHLTAVNNVNVKVPYQSIFSIIGPNGAGKTTFFNCISGFYKIDSGTVLFQGRPINGIPTDEVANLGISRTYQNIRLFSSMSVIENILIGQQPRLRSNPVDAIFQTYRNRREEKQSIQKAVNLLDFVGLTGYGDGKDLW